MRRGFFWGFVIAAALSVTFELLLYKLTHTYGKLTYGLLTHQERIEALQIFHRKMFLKSLYIWMRDSFIVVAIVLFILWLVSLIGTRRRKY